METRLTRILAGHTEPNIFPFLWLHRADEAMLREYVGAIYHANMRAFCVESRPHPDFCGMGWWRDMDILLDEAKKRGMRVWILDDSHFPTGCANGALKNADAGLCRQFLTRTIIDCGEPVPKTAPPSARSSGATVIWRATVILFHGASGIWRSWPMRKPTTQNTHSGGARTCRSSRRAGALPSSPTSAAALTHCGS